MAEPTRIWGNLGNLSAAAGGVLGTTLPGPWGPVAAGILGLVSVILTEVNRSQVTPNGAAVVKATVDKIREANPNSGI